MTTPGLTCATCKHYRATVPITNEREWALNHLPVSRARAVLTQDQQEDS